jgi:hypothetical protein
VGARLAGVALAAVAGLHQVVIASAPTNDDFVHVVLARQVLAGDWPVRDFFDLGVWLTVGLSAAARMVFGYRLLAEGLLVGLMVAISTYLVFRLVQELTGSALAAALSALLLVVAGPRGYSYPKTIVYAGAAVLWWRYVRAPERRTLLWFGAWVAAAFYWRGDHGVYAAMSLVLAVVAAHGLSWMTVQRVTQAGGVALALVVPFLAFSLVYAGFASAAQSGATIVSGQHSTMNSHPWPRWPLRRPSDVVHLDPAEAFAPVVGLRWTADSSPESRAEVLARYGLTPVDGDGPSVQVVRLSERSLSALQPLINEPVVEDTSGIERGSATLPWSTWSVWERWRFAHWWLRFRMLPGVDEQTHAGEATAAIFYGLPLLVLIAAVPWLSRHLPTPATGPRLAIFALVGVVTAVGLMRSPYDVRAVDNVVLPAILFGSVLAAVWRTGASGGMLRRSLCVVVSVALSVLVVKSVAVAGEFGSRVDFLAGDWASADRARGAWLDVRNRLLANPPLQYWDGREAPVQLRLAQYAAACVPSSTRLLVLWFAPEIYYYSDRLMASRHLFSEGGYESLEKEQRLTLDKIRRFDPPLVFATGSLDSYTREMYPGVVDYVHEAYQTAGTVEAEGRRYLILLRKNASVVRSYGDEHWPCLV